jgi:uncharacterized protein
MNPFTLKDYAGPDFFCDRQAETARLINAVENQRNLTLSSLRKMGKTGLIHHVFNQLKQSEDIDAIYFDIFYTESLSGFLNKFGTSILKVEESFPERLKRKINDFIKSIRPTITYDSLTGSPVFSFQIQNESAGIQTLDEIFGFLNTRSLERPMVIAIDEFQQIANYPETNIEALLRSNIQKLQNVNFIFSGSDQQLLVSMFADAKRPFYQSTEFMHLEEIPWDEYSQFIKDKFNNNSILIENEAIEEILNSTRLHTYYVQFLCNRLYSSGIENIGKEDVKLITTDILRENEVYYSEYRDLLTTQQWNLLIALAHEDGINQVTSSAFMKKYDLSNSATIKRGIQSLTDKKMIHKKGAQYYVTDVFFAKWLDWML